MQKEERLPLKYLSYNFLLSRYLHLNSRPFLQFKKNGWLVLLFNPYEISTIQAFSYKIQTFYLYYILDQPVF